MQLGIEHHLALSSTESFASLRMTILILIRIGVSWALYVIRPHSSGLRA